MLNEYRALGDDDSILELQFLHNKVSLLKSVNSTLLNDQMVNFISTKYFILLLVYLFFLFIEFIGVNFFEKQPINEVLGQGMWVLHAPSTPAPPSLPLLV